MKPKLILFSWRSVRTEGTPSKTVPAVRDVLFVLVWFDMTSQDPLYDLLESNCRFAYSRSLNFVVDFLQGH